MLRRGSLVLGVTVAALACVGSAGAAVQPTARDVASTAGIAANVNDLYGSPLVLDYDNDGVSDLLLSRHQVAGAQLFHGSADGSFALVQTLPVADRHGCGAGDFDGDGYADIYCALGADDGTSATKANELWLQDPQSTGAPFALVDGAWGAVDPTGRGRVVSAFDANEDGLTDLFVGNAVKNVYPSPNRLYLNTGTRFVEVVSSVINKSRGLCAAPADYDEDGDMDFFACGTPNHLYRQNADGGWTDLGKALGLSPEQPSRDADWVDIDRDGDLDLVQTSVKTLRIFYSDGAGGFSLGLARTVVAGRAASLADVDADGDDDLYVVQSKSNTASNMPDILMMNSGDGRTFTDYVGLPRATTGSGSSVETMDYLGRPAFVVTNGGAASVNGPRQLIVFDPPPTG
ncbi:FG-GAP repeat domain-containing protein [Nocardioides taihuensis]|uniref:FG-GAP repeat domain-containing protein n=1 Tax=Nocardioides taihuensis TaxID=1835606 RepID=A0ABW0BKW4_9ACTN